MNIKAYRKNRVLKQFQFKLDYFFLILLVFLLLPPTKGLAFPKAGSGIPKEIELTEPHWGVKLRTLVPEFNPIHGKYILGLTHESRGFSSEV